MSTENMQPSFIIGATLMRKAVRVVQWSLSLGYSLFGVSGALPASIWAPSKFSAFKNILAIGSGSTTTLTGITLLLKMNEWIISHNELDKGFGLFTYTSSFPQPVNTDALTVTEVWLMDLVWGEEKQKTELSWMSCLVSAGTICNNHRAEKNTIQWAGRWSIDHRMSSLSFRFCGQIIDVQSKRTQFSLSQFLKMRLLIAS